MDEAPSGPPVPPAPPPPTPMSDRAVAFEVLAVLAIGVLPHLWGSILQIVTPVPPPLPLWLDALDLSFRNGFIIVATLYVIWRSGESWRYFGIVRPGWRDLVIGFGVWLGYEYLIEPICHTLPRDMVGQPWRFPHANSPADYCLMVVEYVANGLGEELVTRAYLITRLERLCGSRAAAVGLSALLFGAYHLYYGFWTGLVCITFMGLFFGGLYLLVRRLWPFALAHALVNIATVLAYSTGPA